MKKTALFLIACSFTVGLFAQISISPIAGVSLCRLKEHISFVPNSKPVPCYFVGVQTNYHFSDKLAVGVGLQFETKGYKVNEGKVSDYTAKYKYLEAIPFIEYRPIPSIGLVAGGSIGLLTYESYKDVNGNGPRDFDYTRPWDLEGLVGLRYYLQDFFISLTYSNSLTTITDIKFTDINGDTIKRDKLMNQSLSLGVGYNFHLKKK